MDRGRKKGRGKGARALMIMNVVVVVCVWSRREDAGRMRRIKVKKKAE